MLFVAAGTPIELQGAELPLLVWVAAVNSSFFCPLLTFSHPAAEVRPSLGTFVTQRPCTPPQTSLPSSELIPSNVIYPSAHLQGVPAEVQMSSREVVGDMGQCSAVGVHGRQTAAVHVGAGI